MNCSASGGEKAASVEAGAGTMRAPLMLEESRVGVDVLLRPEAVKDEGEVRGAFGGIGMGVAELRKPGEVQEVVVESGADWEGCAFRRGC
jgi:hypothetical protein